MKKMEIENFDNYSDIICRMINLFEDFESALEIHDPNENVLEFMREDLQMYETFQSIRENIEKINIPKRPYSKKNLFFRDKMLLFLYSNLIRFHKTDKIKGIPLSKKNCFKCNAHTFCNEKVRENYFKIPVIAHNLFRVDFFSHQKT